MKKKVLIITYYWPPSGGAGVQRWVKFAKYLSRMNVETYVLTVDPKFATYPQIDKSLLKDIPESVKVFYAKSFELYSLYKRISSNKEVPYGGFVNTPKLNFKEKFLRFIRGNFFLPDPRKGWNRYAYKKAIEIIKGNNIKTVITTSPPHSTQLLGLKLKRKLDIKWIADFRDPWTDIYYYKQLYPTKIATSINRGFEQNVFKFSDKIITVSKDLKRLFSNKLKDIDNKIEIIANGFDLDDFSDVVVNQAPDLFYISYIGTITNDYKIDGFLNGINQLSDNIKAKLRIRFVGKISSELIDKIDQFGLKDITEIKGYVEHKEAISFMFSTNILLLIIPSVKDNKGILTGKLFEYLAANRPILFLGPTDGDAAKIINDSNSGIICSYSDQEKITDSITNLFNKSEDIDSENSINPETLKYSRKKLTETLIDLI